MESLIDLDYNSEDLCIYLYLLNEIIKEKDFKPYFYINSTDKEQILEFLKDYEKKHKLDSEITKMIEKIETVKKIVFDENYQEKELSKVTVKYPNNVKTVREILSNDQKTAQIIKDKNYNITIQDMVYLSNKNFQNATYAMVVLDIEDGSRYVVMVDITERKVFKMGRPVN